MATITWERNQNTVLSPTWVDIGANTMVFSGSATDLTTPIGTTSWNDGFHIGSNDPGTDQCGGGPYSSHCNCVKFLTTSTMSVNGGGSEAINDTNLTEGECTLRIHLNNATAVQTQNTFFFCFDGGGSDLVEAVGVEAYAFERGVSATAWTQVNDDSGNIGGNNAGERLDLGEKSAATDLYWYLALSARAESAGPKTSFDFKIVTEIF